MESALTSYDVATRSSSTKFVSRGKVVLFAFLALALIVGCGFLGAFVGPSRLASRTKFSSRSGNVVVHPTHDPNISTKPPQPRLWDSKRLPGWIWPLHYNLTVFVNIAQKIFNGSVDVQIYSMRNSKYVIIHSKQLTIRSVKIRLSDGAGIKLARFFMVTKNDYLVLEMDEHIPSGLAFVSIEFTAGMSTDLTGLYASTYPELNGSLGIVAATFYAPVAARKSFPCFDEPSLKAKFTVRLIHSSRYVAVANMPIVTRRNLPSGLVRSEFQTSVRMSTYLVCFVVGNFGYRETMTAHGVKVRVWAPKHLVDQTQYSLEAANHTLTFFENLFQIRYHLPKLDMVALPNFLAGAMENWGLITYRATRLLTQKNKSSERERQDILTIVSHEVAHQWFGNLVTMQWWNDTWLNEGFASYMEYFGADSFEPSMNLMEQFVLSDLYPVMELDPLQSSRPLSMKVESTDAINQMFDVISYNKGAAILRMARDFLGNDAFFQGLRNYLKKYAYKNTNQDELWEELRRVSNKSVKEIMDTWTLQSGFPILDVSRVDTDRIKVSQERFLLGGLKNSKEKSSFSPFNYTWQVPLTWISQHSGAVVRSAILKSKEMILNVSDNGWFKLNRDTTGYYIVHYDNENWSKLTRQLILNHTAFSPLDRANLVSDVFNLAYVGKVSYRVALESIKYLKKERDWVPWKIAIDSVSRMNRLLSKTCNTKKLLTRYLESLTWPVVDALGWQPQKRVADVYLQADAIVVAGRSGNANVTQKLLEYFRLWMAKGAEIPAKFKHLAYFLGVENGGEKEWDFVFKQYQTTENIAEKKLLLQALGATKSPWIMQRFLDYSIDDTKIPKEDGASAIIAAAKGSSDGRFLAWEFIQDNWDKIMALYGDGIFLLNRMLHGVLGEFSNQYELEMVQKFVKSRPGLDGVRSRFKKVMEKIKSNISWKKKHEDDIRAWLTLNLPMAPRNIS